MANIFDVFGLECPDCGELKENCECQLYAAEIAEHRAWASRVNAEWDRMQTRYHLLTGEYLPDPALKVPQ